MHYVLLVEPNKIIASHIEAYLTSEGYRVTTVHDAQAAIVAVDKATPDIVVLEVLLSKHSGIEFLYEFRSYAEWQDVPVIVFSRVSQAELRLTAKTMQELTIGAVLYKPRTSLAKLGSQLKVLLESTKKPA